MNATETKNVIFGLLIERTSSYSTDYVVARIVTREDDHPLNPRDGFDVPFYMEDLQLRPMIYRYKAEPAHALGMEPEYRDVHSVDAKKAKKMAKTLARVEAKIAKDQSTEAGDVFTSFANALKLSFAVEMVGTSKGSSYRDNEWRFMSIAQGRDRFRRLITAACDEANARAPQAA